MKGTSTTSSTGTGTIQGRGVVTGTSSGLSTCTGWFPQIGQLIGSGTGSSIVAQVTRPVVNITSTITLISEYVSGI